MSAVVVWDSHFEKAHFLANFKMSSPWSFSPLFHSSAFIFLSFFKALSGLCSDTGQRGDNRLLIGWCFEPHPFQAGRPNPPISHTVWEEYRENMAKENEIKNEPLGSCNGSCAAAAKTNRRSGVIPQENKVLKRQTKKSNLVEYVHYFSCMFFIFVPFAPPRLWPGANSS